MNDCPELATAILAILFASVLPLTGYLYMEHRATREANNSSAAWIRQADVRQVSDIRLVREQSFTPTTSGPPGNSWVIATESAPPSRLATSKPPKHGQGDKTGCPQQSCRPPCFTRTKPRLRRVRVVYDQSKRWLDVARNGIDEP
jgi:hypothetical protein